jgi:N-acetylglucosaminyldiphosphoundecaprenol N-acetyl-beta-D-mannosaminyltransferase
VTSWPEGIPRVDVLGVGISCVDVETTVDVFAKWIANDAREYVCVTGMHGVMESQTDELLRDIHNHSGLTTPDGMSMVFAGRSAGAPLSRVYGPDLMEAVFATAHEVGWSSYFLGGAPGVAERLITVLRACYPFLAVAGYESPPYRPLNEGEDDELVARINASGADIVWVALGTPKQERWMAATCSTSPASDWRSCAGLPGSRRQVPPNRTEGFARSRDQWTLTKRACELLAPSLASPA